MASSASGPGLGDYLTAIQNGVTAVNNLTLLLTKATINSSSLQIALSSTFYTNNTGTVTTVNSGTGLTGGPITSSGTLAVSLTNAMNSISSDVALSNVSNYFTGPSVNVGTSGVWFVSGQVTLAAPSANDFNIRLWDGTTVINSACAIMTAALADPTVVSLSGVITNPASNIKIAVNDQGATTGKILANISSQSSPSDSTITAVRIG